jgi:hypothetical protein
VGPIETVEVIPDPVSLIASMRAVGYSVEAAIADIIDNSLSADATSIHVRYDAAKAPFVAILDDGHGMGPKELTNAMRHGSSNPADHRAANDLGRFGLGLKTASLSQCRKLTVVSKKNNEVSARQWDLDLVRLEGKWLVVVPRLDDLAQLPMFEKLEAQPSGTLVVWQELDRLTAGSRNPEQEMTAKMAPLFEHLALVFHRFTQSEAPHPAVAMMVNGLQLPSRDPFLGANHYRQELEGQTIAHERGKVVVSPYVLPPVSNLSPQEIETAGGREGLRGTQGFYVYRNRRLVIWGTWFRLVPKEEFYKLTRIQVDIPNSFDDLWALDIKKSAAYPPDPIRTRLKELIPHFAETSRRAITYKGRKVNGKGYVPMWNRIETKRRTFRYEPNSEHPLIQKLSQILGDAEQRHLQMILDFLGAAIPYDGIYADMCGDDRNNDQEDMKELLEMAESLLEVTGLGIDRILEIDPLCRRPELHQALREELEK